VRVSSPGALVPGALVGGGLAGGVAIIPRTMSGTFGWRPWIAGEVSLVDGGLARVSSSGALVPGALVGGGLAGGVGGTRIIKPITGKNCGCGGGSAGGVAIIPASAAVGKYGWRPPIGGEIRLVNGGSVRVISPGALVLGALVDGGLGGGVILKPKTITGRPG